MNRAVHKWLASGIIACAIVACSASFAPQPNGRRLSYDGPPHNPAQLGERLFFEPALSLTGKISCASCHIPEYAFADTAPVSKGVNGHLGRRNTPSCMNMSSRDAFFYDGRAATLEDQVHFPVEDKNEMSLPMATVIQRLCADKRYIAYFQEIYHSLPTATNVAAAIATYERTLETAHTPFDRYMNNDDSSGMSMAALRGRQLFMSARAKCFDCHFSPDFTGDEFRNIGLFDGVTLNDSGRYEMTHNPADIGKFKVPGLRNVAVTAPYMHNGMFHTLRQVIDYYDNPYSTVAHPLNMDTLMQQPLHLTEGEKYDLEQFLLTLTDDRFRHS
ncbi:MAG: cytochrome-c peroxidase [Chitinophagia bacterium]|nr:cytochrome-c peroxidase [Chitinophagia bacterium]